MITIIQVTDGWETAYYTNFSLYGGGQPIVLSYSTSPAFEQLLRGTATRRRSDRQHRPGRRGVQAD